MFEVQPHPINSPVPNWFFFLFPFQCGCRFSPSLYHLRPWLYSMFPTPLPTTSTSSKIPAGSWGRERERIRCQHFRTGPCSWKHGRAIQPGDDSEYYYVGLQAGLTARCPLPGLGQSSCSRGKVRRRGEKTEVRDPLAIQTCCCFQTR